MSIIRIIISMISILISINNSIRSSQEQPEAARSSQDQPGPARNNLKQPGARNDDSFYFSWRFEPPRRFGGSIRTALGWGPL